MEIHFTPDPEMQAWLSHTAAREGLDMDAVLRETLKQRMAYDDWFVREVDKGIVAADRGELVSHDEVGARMENWIARHKSS